MLNQTFLIYRHLHFIHENILYYFFYIIETQKNQLLVDTKICLQLEEHSNLINDIQSQPYCSALIDKQTITEFNDIFTASRNNNVSLIKQYVKKTVSQTYKFRSFKA